MTRLVLTAALLLMVGACEAPAPRAAMPAGNTPLFETFGDLHRDIGSDVPAAQRYFDQGLRLAYGFNHEAAGRAFAEAARLDPDCAICIWGQALVLGPNINMPMPADAAAPATQLAKRALARAGAARPADRALIEALAVRYADPAPQDRKGLDQAYADAMARVVRDFPDDDDAATLHAEALMDLSPWAYWTADGSAANSNTDVLVATLERVLQRNPDHIGAMHYYIHAVEASKTPERAEAHADRLAALAPGSGHLVHMPAHIYIRVGRYHDATLSNFAASTADQAFLAVCRGSNGVYPLGYVPHNWHFASMSTGLTGSRTLALQAAEQTARRVDHAAMGQPPMEFMQMLVATPLFAQVRFGQWDAILAQAGPPAAHPFPTAMWRFARGMALLRTGKTAESGRELDALRAIAQDPALAKVTVGTNTAAGVLGVATPLLHGELLRAQGKRAQGIAALREAAVAEDKLNYTEPADWPLPTRWYLGAALLDAGDARGAAEVYRQDLQTYPHNGWSLYGLAQAERRLGNVAAAADSERRYRTAWQWADEPLTASRY